MYSPQVTCLCVYRKIKVPLPFNAAFTLLSWKVSSHQTNCSSSCDVTCYQEMLPMIIYSIKEILTVQKSVIFVLLFIYSYKNLYCG